MLAIRLARGGSKKRPYYRLVVADNRSPRDGRFIEKLGTYNPLLAKDSPDRVKLDADRIAHWLSVGAQPSDRVARFLDAAGIRERAARNNPTKGVPGEKATERVEERATKATAAAEAAEAAAAAPKVEESVAEEPIVAEELVAEEAATIDEAPAAQANEATPNSDGGDSADAVTGESAQEPAEGAAEVAAEVAEAEAVAAPAVAAEDAPIVEAEAAEAEAPVAEAEAETPAAEEAAEKAE